MHYTFHSRSYPDPGDALVAFDMVNRRMQQHIPDAFLSAFETDHGDHVLLLGCSDEDSWFPDALDVEWCGGKPYDASIDVCMAMEARHSRLLNEHAQNAPDTDLVMTNIAPLLLTADGMVTEREDIDS